MTTTIRHLLPAVLCALLISCAGKEEVSTELPAQPRLYRVTFEQALTFAKEVDAGLHKAEFSMIDSAFDREEWLRRVAYTTARPEALIAALDSTSRELSPGGLFLKKISACRNLTFIGLFWNSGQPRAFYRIEFASGGIDYAELILGEDRQGRLRVVDAYFHTDVDPLSVRTRRMVSDGPSMVEAMFGRGTVTIGSVLDSLSKLQRYEDYKEILAYCASLPERLRYDRYVLPVRIVAASRVSRPEHLSALEDLHAHHAGDKSMSLLMIDYFFEKKQYDSAMNAINSADSAVGGDPYANILRAGVKYNSGDYDKARMYARRMLAKDSSSVIPYVVLLKVAITERRFIEATQIAGIVRDRFGATLTPDMLRADDDLVRLPALGEYLASKEYAAFSEANQQSN